MARIAWTVRTIRANGEPKRFAPFLIQICVAVSQTCSEDGMEFTLKTPEGFLGRIYTHGYYDRCFQRGNGGLVNALRISGAQGYPDCGTIRVSTLDLGGGGDYRGQQSLTL